MKLGRMLTAQMPPEVEAEAGAEVVGAEVVGAEATMLWVSVRAKKMRPKQKPRLTSPSSGLMMDAGVILGGAGRPHGGVMMRAGMLLCRSMMK